MKNLHKLIGKIRQLSVLTGILVLLINSVSAQNITRIEYFYDTDPGFGSGTAVSFTPAANISSLTFSPSISSLNDGFHTLYIRSRDANNKWSLTSYQSFVKYKAPTATAAAHNIVKLEYFVDADPGFGAGTNVPVTSSLDISGQVFNINLAGLNSGFHTLYVRSKDGDGKWSLTDYSVFLKYVAPSANAAAHNIVKLEYFVDADPGFGAGTNVPITPAMDISGQVFNVNLAGLSSGFHTLYVRSKDADGKWSLTDYSSFIKYTAPTSSPAASNIVKLEYFVDADPGFGLGVNVPVTPSLNISSLVFNVSLTSLTNGFHTLYARSKDADGKWAITNLGSFIKYAPQSGIAAAGKVIKLEYFIDTDPGFGNGGNIPFTHATDVSALVANIDLTSIASGFHTLYIRSMDTLHKWSLTNYASFTGGQLQAPTASITVIGPTTFCAGTGTYLQANYSAAATYQWKLNGNTINGATGITYVPVASGSYTVVVTNAISSATSAAVSITVNSVPTATISANGSLTFCQGGSVTLSVNATANATYQWHKYGNNIGGANTTSYIATASGIYDVAVTGSNGCATTSAKDTVVVNPSPTATITPIGSTTFCSGDSVLLYANTGAGLTYHWSNNATTNFITVKTQGTYALTVTNTSNCSATAAGVVVTVLTAPTASITANGPTTFCNGSSVLLSANTGSGLSYVWSGGSTASSITVSSSGTYYVTVSNAGCSKVSSPVTVTVNPGPVVSIIGNGSTVCQGHADTLTASGATTYTWSPGTGLNTTTGAQVIATPSAGTTYTVTGTTSGCIGTASFTVNISANNTQVSTTTSTICSGSSAILNASGANTYVWSPSGTLNSSTGASVTATPLAQTTYTVTGTSGTCSSTASITINVNATVVPSVTVSATQSTICPGTSVTFTAVPINGGSGPSYQWYKNGVLQSGNNSTFSSSSLANNDSVWCVMTSHAVCPMPSTATANKIHMTVNPSVVPTISVSVTQNPVCTGTSVTFSAIITNGGSNPTYVWKKNNVTVGSNSSIYVLASPTNSDSVWCILTSNAPCATPTTVTSSKVKMVVNQVSAPTVTVSASQNPICVGGTITFSATPTNGGASPSYQWYKNGLIAGTNADTYTDNSLSTNDSIWCLMTSNASCASPLTATSNKVVVVIAPNVIPSVVVSTPQTSVCAGTSITFSAAPTNGGGAPVYQWYKNGIVQAGNTNTYTTAVANNDSVWCVMTSVATCPVPATATSNKLHLTVNPTVTPTISIVSSTNAICAGDSVTFTANITNGGATPIYQWKKNNVNVGNGTSVYGTSSLAAGDSVWCVLTSTAPCPSPASVISNKKKVTVNAIVTPTISVAASQNPICSGATVTFTASITHGGGAPIYQWYKNGATVGTSSSTYSDNALSSNDSVWCRLTSNANCASTTVATSNKVIITITPTVIPTVTISASQSAICPGTSVTFTASPVNGGGSPTYHWYKNGVLQSGNSGTFSSTGLANGDSVWTVMTSAAQCPSPTTAGSNKVLMTVYPTVVPTIAIVASQSTLCAGDSVTFTASITNGGTTPIYQWKKNNVNVGNGTSVYSTAALLNNDSVWCVLTSNAPCPSPASVIGNKIHLTVNPVTSPAISVSASQNNICVGVTVTFTATPVNGGSAPVYTWYKNGVVTGTNSSTYTDNSLASNDSVWCLLTSNKICASPNTALSNKVMMLVTPTVTPSAMVSASNTTICLGTVVTFTATPTNGGSSPVYQWRKNGMVQSGSGALFITSNLANNDSIWCSMTSNATCAVPISVVSNKTTMTVLQPAYSTMSAAICQGGNFSFGGNNLTHGGTYSDTLLAAAVNGCDSIVQLTLTVNPVITTSLNATICNGSSYPFKGDNLTVGGVYRDTLASASSCDSFVVLTLTVNNPVSVATTADICQGDVYVFGTQNLSSGGVYTDTTQGSNACDSITTLTLHVHALPVPVITRSGTDTLRTGAYAHFTWFKDGLQLADTNRTIIVHADGSYAVLVADSNGCSDTSASMNVTGTGIADVSMIHLQVYPNPTENVLQVRAENLTEAMQVELQDELGRTLFIREENSSVIHETFDLSKLSAGMYLLVVKSKSRVYTTQRVLKL